MLWMDYNIRQFGTDFMIEGDEPHEVMKKGLYKPGDVFVVQPNGILRRVDELSGMILKHDDERIVTGKLPNVIIHPQHG